MEHGKGPVHFLSGEGIGHLEHHRVNDGDGHRVNVLPGDPAILGVRPDLSDLGNQAVHQVTAEEDQVLGVRRVNVVAQGPEPADNPVHQITLSLPDEGHLRPFVPDNPGQFFHAGIPFVGHRVIDKDQTAVLRQIGENLGHGVPLGLGGFEEVIVADHHQGALAHHGQGIHRLRQLLGGEGLARQEMVVEALHPGGNQFGLHLVQIVVPEIGLLPMKDVQRAQGPLGKCLLELPVSLLPRIFLIFFCHHVSSPLWAYTVIPPCRSVRYTWAPAADSRARVSGAGCP